MISQLLWPHKTKVETLSPEQLSELLSSVLESPYLAESDLNEGFSSTKGFSIMFRRDQLDRAKELMPTLVPYFDSVLKPEANAFFLTPLVITGGGAVGAHADKTLASYIKSAPYPFCVSVLYLSLPSPRTGGNIVFHRWFGRHTLSPKENLLLEFPGWLKHEVTEMRSEDENPRVSMVLEQYKLEDAQLEALTPWHLDSCQSFEFFLDAALDGEEEDEERMSQIKIVDYKSEYKDAFRDINLEWVEEMFEVEGADREVLDNPQEHILDDGGVIVLALVDGLPMGTGALRKTGPDEYELTKMGVLKKSRGLGLGRLVLDALIERAQNLGAQRLYLLTNTDCGPAIKLYEARGFLHDAAILEEFGKRYKRADVGMTFPLAQADLSSG